MRLEIKHEPHFSILFHGSWPNYELIQTGSLVFEPNWFISVQDPCFLLPGKSGRSRKWGFKWLRVRTSHYLAGFYEKQNQGSSQTGMNCLKISGS